MTHTSDLNKSFSDFFLHSFAADIRFFSTISYRILLYFLFFLPWNFRTSQISFAFNLVSRSSRIFQNLISCLHPKILFRILEEEIFLLLFSITSNASAFMLHKGLLSSLRKHCETYMLRQKSTRINIYDIMKKAYF